MRNRQYRTRIDDIANAEHVKKSVATGPALSADERANRRFRAMARQWFFFHGAST